jgi:hypothetical protein
LQEPAASFYHWNPRVEPNSSIYLLLAGLIRLTGDALIANTLFLSLYGLLWIVSAFIVCRTRTDRPLLPFLLLLPLAFGVAIHWGFYGYSLSVPLFLLFASFWSKVRERHSAIRFVATALFLLGLYLTHISAAAAACLLLAADGIARAIRALDRSGIRAAGRQLLMDGVWAAAADPESMAKFRNANHGAPQVLIVSSAGQDGSALARKLGYGDCKMTRGGGRKVAVCKATTRLSEAHR